MQTILVFLNIKSSKQDLYDYYETHRTNKHPTPTQTSTPQTPASSAGAPSHSSQKNFTVCFHRKTTTIINELNEYFKLPPKDFERCNPVHWWMGRQAQFPNLFWFAQDLLCIPGTYVCNIMSFFGWTIFRVCCCSRVSFLRWLRHNLSVPCKPTPRNHQNSHACQEEASSGVCSVHHSIA